MQPPPMNHHGEARDFRPCFFFHNYHCKEVVDHVDGVLGICSEDIPIDYNLSPRELCLSILAHLIPKEHDHHTGPGRIESLVEGLEAALKYRLTEADYALLSVRLKSEHARHGSGEANERWWFCENDEFLAVLLSFNIAGVGGVPRAVFM
jgi:hypothetical protein